MKLHVKSHTEFAITICSSPLLKYWIPWLFWEPQWVCSIIHSSFYPERTVQLVCKYRVTHLGVWFQKIVYSLIKQMSREIVQTYSEWVLEYGEDELFLRPKIPRHTYQLWNSTEISREINWVCWRCALSLQTLHSSGHLYRHMLKGYLSMVKTHSCTKDSFSGLQWSYLFCRLNELNF